MLNKQKHLLIVHLTAQFHFIVVLIVKNILRKKLFFSCLWWRSSKFGFNQTFHEISFFVNVIQIVLLVSYIALLVYRGSTFKLPVSKEKKYIEIFQKHPVALKTISLSKMQDLWRTSVPIIKLQILINIKTFLDWNVTHKIVIFNCSQMNCYWLLTNNISRIIIRKIYGIEFCSIFKHGFIFKINQYSFNFKWKS